MRTGRKICFLPHTLRQISHMRDFKDALPPGFSAKVVIVAFLKWCSYFFSSRLPDGVNAEELTSRITPHLQKKLIHSPALGTPEWHNDMFRRACRWYRCYHWYLQRYDAIVIWGGFAMPLAIAALVAEKLGKKVIYIESGELPGTIVLDLQGVNYNCSLRGVGSDFYRSQSYTEEEHSSLRATLFPQRGLRKKVRSRDMDTGVQPNRINLPANLPSTTAGTSSRILWPTFKRFLRHESPVGDEGTCCRGKSFPSTETRRGISDLLMRGGKGFPPLTPSPNAFEARRIGDRNHLLHADDDLSAARWFTITC